MNRTIQLAHGGGGQLTAELVAEVILPSLGADVSAQDPRALADAAVVTAPAHSCGAGVSPARPEGVPPSETPANRQDVLPRQDQRGRDARATSAGAMWALTTDSYVVWPLEFPGGDIGRLAVCGTVNDLAVCGAAAAGLSLALVLEEGLEVALLRRVLVSAGRSAKQAGVRIVTGDTKVVERGGLKGMVVNTSGVGVVSPSARLGFGCVKPGDRLVLTGPLGEHGLAVLCHRQGLRTELSSDCAPLNGLCRDLIDHLGPEVRWMRDPTRGGLAAAVCDLANGCGMGIELDELALPQHRTARAASEMLGLDLLTVANEGKLLAVVSPQTADQAVTILRRHEIAAHAAVIGTVTQSSRHPLVELLTTIGGRRIIQMPYGEELPRIC